MKRFKRPISEVAKGLFHQGSGDSKPVIPNLGVNSKKAEGSSPAKLRGGSSSSSSSSSGGGKGGGGGAKADPYAKAAKNDPKLGEYVKARKSLKKGTAEWNANQNKINKAYGVSKRYDETAKPTTTVNTNTEKNPPTETTKVTQPTDAKKITSENVTVKSRKQERSEGRVEKLQNKAAEDGSLSKGQKRRLARNEQKAKGEKVSYKNRSFLGKLVRKKPKKKKENNKQIE